MKRIVFDVDGTLTVGEKGDYANARPHAAVVARLREYKAEGYEIVLATSRNMRTHQGNVGKINLHTAPVLLEWLRRHDIPCDELWFGKPWCGDEGFYVDDRSIRPDEFTRLSPAEIHALLHRTGS